MVKSGAGTRITEGFVVSVTKVQRSYQRHNQTISTYYRKVEGEKEKKKIFSGCMFVTACAKEEGNAMKTVQRCWQHPVCISSSTQRTQ